MTFALILYSTAQISICIEAAMSTIKELINAVADKNIDFEPILFRAKILAASLNNDAFSKWVESELNGYGVTELPEYRKLHIKPLGTFRNLAYQINAEQIPLQSITDMEMRELLSTIRLAHSIPELEHMTRGGNNQRISMDSSGVQYLNRTLHIEGGYVLLEAHYPMPSYLIKGVVSTARSRFLDFLISIQKETGDSELDAIQIDSSEAERIFNISIQGDHNTFVAGNRNIISNKNAVVKGDWQSLVKALHGEGVTAEEISELETAVQQDQKTGQRIGENTKGWLARMYTKALSGAGKISVAVATRTLYNYIAAHHGLPPMP